MDYIWNWIWGLVGLIGTIFTFYFGNKSNRLEKARKKLEWAEIQSGTNDLGKKLRREFSPDIILTPGLRGGIIAKLILNVIDTNIPTFVGISFWKQNNGGINEIEDYIPIKTKKWDVYIPNNVLKFKDKKILIIDDFAMSGDFIDKLKKILLKNGFSEDNIKSLCVATTKVAISNHKAPDYYWMKTEDDDFYFPWGKAK